MTKILPTKTVFKIQLFNEQIALIVNSKVRTLETRIIPNKKAPEGANLFNGASKGRELEDNCVFVAHQTLHETELMMNIKKWIRA